MGYELDGRRLPSLEFDTVLKSCVTEFGFGSQIWIRER